MYQISFAFEMLPVHIKDRFRFFQVTRSILIKYSQTHMYIKDRYLSLKSFLLSILAVTRVSPLSQHTYLSLKLSFNTEKNEVCVD